MRFICSTFGSAGDVFPMLGLALELQRRGHEVTLATNAHFADLSRRCGVPFEPLGTAEQYRACIDHPDLWSPGKAFPHIFRMLKQVLKQQYEIHAQPGTIGITNCFGAGALLSQEKLGIPAITVHLQPAVLWSKYQPPAIAGLFGPPWLKDLIYSAGERWVIDPVVCPFLNAWRGELGLRPVRRITRWWHSPIGVVCLFPEWYAPPQPDWPAPLVQTDFPLWNFRGEGPAGMDAEVDSFLNAGDPPIVFTPGSANVHGRQFFEAAVESCRKLGRRGILLTEYSQQLPGPLRRTSDTSRMCRSTCCCRAQRRSCITGEWVRCRRRCWRGFRRC